VAGMTALALTGSTGRLGGRIATRLAAAGAQQRLLVRDPQRAPQLPGSEIAIAELADTEEVRRALEGVDTLLMVSGSETPDRVSRHKAFIDAAAAAGVGHLVYTSFIGASPDATFTLARDHGATEAHLKASGLPYTVLRDNLYADFLPVMVGEDGAIRGPAGEGRVAAVTQDDIADAATAVLLSPAAHLDRTYDLTGPQAITLGEAAEVLTKGLGREIRYVAETLEEAYDSRQVYGAPDWQVEAWVSTYTAIAAGELAQVTDHIEQLTGHPAMSLVDLLQA
jgi:NAD(P)H dehydrogenase (quinone)